MQNEELIAECKKYLLPVSDKHVHNIQTLLNFVKLLEGKITTTKPKESEQDDLTKNLKKSFNRNLKTAD